MRSLHSSFLVSLAAALSFVACSSEIARNNQYDPEGEGPRAPGRIVGQVMVEGAAVLEGLVVSVFDARETQIPGSPFTTRGGGSFDSPEMPPGTYHLTVAVPRGNFPIELANVRVLPGIDTDVGLLSSFLRPAEGTIVGRIVLDDEGASPAATRVILTALDQGAPLSRLAFTDSSGDYSFTNLPPGAYEVRADRQDFTPDLVTVDVSESTRSTASAPELHLYPISAVAKFVIDRDGQSVIGARFTNVYDVSLLLLAFGGVNEMRVSESRAFVEGTTPVAWRDHQAEITLSLSDGEGEKTVYTQFRKVDALGNERLRSDTYAASIVVDQTPPAILDLVVAPSAVEANDARYLVGDPNAVPVQVVAVDNASPIARLKLLVENADPDLVPWDVLDSDNETLFYAGLVSVSSSEGTKRVAVQLRDAAGNASAETDRVVAIDHTAPSVGATSVLINGGLAITNSQQVALALNAADGMGSGVRSMALANNSIDCATANFEPYATTRNWTLPGANTAHTVYACFKDAVGNVAQASSGIELDTIAPAPGTLSLAAGGSLTNDDSVLFALAGGSPDVLVRFSGDLVAVGVDAAGWTYWNSTTADADGAGSGHPMLPSPQRLTLSPGDGEKSVSAVFTDRAGNSSAPFFDTVEVDTTAPALGSLRVNGASWSAGDAPIEVFQSNVTIEIVPADADAAYVDVSENALDMTACNPGVDGCRAITANQVLGLSSNPGDKTLYYRFFDQAGNGNATAGGGIAYGEFHLRLINNRPLPVLAFVTPTSILALQQSTYSLIFVGRSFATDTLARIGDFEVSADCSLAGTYAGVACTPANADASSCDGDADCRNCCEVRLDASSPAWQLTRLSGSYLARMVTPAPVVGTGVSAEARIVNVVAPAPAIDGYSVLRGVGGACLLGVLDDCDFPFHDVWGIPESSSPQSFYVVVWGEGLLDNSSLRLPGRFAQTLYSGPFTRGGAPAGEGLIAQFSGFNMLPSDAVYDLTVVNPAPGGGELDLPFGVNWAQRQVTATITSSIRKTDFITRTQGIFAEAYANPGYTPQTQLLQIDPNLTIGAPDHHVTARDTAGGLLVRAAPSARSFGFPLGMSPLMLSVEGRPGPSTWRIGSAPQPRPTGAFGPEATFPIGSFNDYYSRSTGLAVGDITGDGKHDFASANALEPNVDIYRGDGVGNFTLWASVFTGQTGGDVALGDFDGDGTSDLAIIAGAYSSSLNILLNRGGGAFTRVGPFPAGYLSQDLKVGDLNDDGRLDLVAAGSDVTPFFNVGGGSFARAASLDSNASWPEYVGLGDLDGDGDLDIVASNTGTGNPAGDDIAVFLNHGDGVFGAAMNYLAGDYPQAPSLIDMNGDGALDVVVGNSGAGGISGESFTVIPGLGDGQFGPPIETAFPGSDVLNVAVGDLNGDATPDVLVTRTDSGYIADVLFGDGDGTFTPLGSTYAISQDGARAHELADLNEDGVLDLISAGYLTVNVRLGQSTATTAPVAANTTRRQSNLTTADFNRDGWPDVATATYDKIEVFTNNAGVAWAGPTTLGAGIGYSWVEAVDFNANGAADLVAADTTSPRITVFYGGGTGTFPTTYNLPLAHLPRSLHVADVNADGRQDVLVVYDGQSKIGLFLQTGTGTLGAESALALPFEARAVASLDANADGMLDLAVVTGTAAGSGESALHLLRATATGFARHTIAPAFAWHPRWLSVADLNLDGNPDIVVESAGEAFPFLGAGGVGFTAAPPVPHEAWPTGFAIADFNNDGIPDLAQNSDNETLVTLRLGRGDGTFGEMVQYGYPQSGRIGPLLAGDFDRNRVPDLLVGEGSESGLGLLLYSSGSVAQPLRQELGDLPLATVPALATGATEYVAATHQAAQDVGSVGVLAQLAFTAEPTTGSVTASVVGPNGTSVTLGTFGGFVPWPDAGAPERWLLTIAQSSATTAALRALIAMQPAGEWSLAIDNDTGLDAEVTGFTVTTVGTLVGPPVGDRADHVETLAWPPGGIGQRIARGTTVGYSNKRGGGCVAGVSPDRYYEFSLATTRGVLAEATGDYDVVLRLYAGPCAATTATLACDNNGWGVGTNARINAGQRGAGTYCLVVDGNSGYAGNYVLNVELGCATGEHDGGMGTCVAAGTCSAGYQVDGGGNCTLCAAGYHDGGLTTCVPSGTCSPGFENGGDGSCVPAGTCATGYHDGGGDAGACVPLGTCSTGYAVDGGGDCTLCATGYHDGGGGDGLCLPIGTCSAGYHDGGNGDCAPLGACALGYHDDGLGTCVPLASCASGYHDGGFGECVAVGTCEDSHVLGAGDCASCTSGHTVNTSGQCLASALTCPADDGREPNDSLATASTITAGTRVDGIFCAGAGEYDWHSVAVPSGCRVDAQLYFAHAEGNLALALYDGEAVEIGDLAQDNEFARLETQETNAWVIVFSQGVAPLPVATRYALYTQVVCP